MYSPFREPAKRWLARSRTEPTVNLSVDRSGSNYVVSWSRDLPNQYAGSSATLEIYDGSQRKSIAIDHELLSSGRIYYSPTSSDVRFRLSVTLTPQRKVNESVQVVAPESGERIEQPPAMATPAVQRTPPKKVDAKPVVRPSRQASMPQHDQRPLPRKLSARSQQAAPTVRVQAPQLPLPAQSLKTEAPRSAAPQLTPDRKTDSAQQMTPASGMQTKSVTQEKRAPNEPPFHQRIAVIPPRVKRQVPLVIPSDVKRLIHEDITIQVKAFIDAAGRVTRTQSLTRGSFVVTALSRAAENNAALWTFVPAMLTDTPTPTEFVVEYRIKAPR